MALPLPEERNEPVLILAPTGADARIASGLLSEIGVATRICSTMAEIVLGVEGGAGAVVLASEALDDAGAELLSGALAGQPAWSDIPVIVLTLGEDEGLRRPLDALLNQAGKISLLERPFRAASFVSALKVALRARRRQFQVRTLLESERRALARAATESRRADSRERELRASEERFRLIANSIPQLAWMADPDGRLFWFNQRWYEFSGADAGDARAGWRAWMAAQDPDHLRVAEQAWRESLATARPFDAELPMQRRDGQRRWFLTRAVPAVDADGRPTLWFGTSTDITEHRATAEALRQSEERLRLAVETAQLGLWTLSPAERTLEHSPAFAMQLGRPGRDIAFDDFWAAVHPQDRVELERRLDGAVHECAPLAVEFRVRGADGDERWILARATPVAGAGFSPVELVGVSLDVTGRKQSDARREAALTAERAARSEAERVARMKDDFVATLSHELRTPLNAVLGWAEVLQRTGAAGGDFERGLAAITRNARLQAQLIEDLLDTSRIVSGSLDLDFATVALAEVVDAAIESVLPSAAARRIEIQRRYEAAPTVDGDRRRLQQIAWNLLTNAVKFSLPGGTVTVRIAAEAGSVVLEVQDAGQGIEAQFLPSLFERFRQQDSSRKRRSGGLGLGLSIVKHLVDLHGGRVEGQSEGPGRGARFRVALPRAATTDATVVAAPPPPGEMQMRTLQHARILVVDDEVDARELAARILRERQATVLLAASADEALALVKREAPDLIVSDIGMPDKDGLEFIREVRALGGAAGRSPALALTAFARHEDRDAALAAGFQRHLRKPIDALVFAAACAELLTLRAQPPRRGAPAAPNAAQTA